MKKIVGILGLIFILTLAACAPAEITGEKIKGVDEMTEKKTIEAMMGNVKNYTVYDVEDEYITKLHELLCKTTFTKDKEAKLEEADLEKMHLIVLEYGENEENIITIYGDKYLSLSQQFKDTLYKINDAEFINKLTEILELE